MIFRDAATDVVIANVDLYTQKNLSLVLSLRSRGFVVTPRVYENDVLSIPKLQVAKDVCHLL